jgi:hypothetical protein
MVACSSGADVGDAGDAGDAGGGPCTTTADCSQGFGCAYEIADGCGAKGTCVPMDIGAGMCDAGGAVVCDCSGNNQPANVCVFHDTTVLGQPTAHTGACVTEAGGD